MLCAKINIHTRTQTHTHIYTHLHTYRVDGLGTGQINEVNCERIYHDRIEDNAEKVLFHERSFILTLTYLLT